MTTVSKEHISKTPGICGGKACIAGHRIRVMDVVVMYERWGFSPDQIADQYPGLTLADVHAALAYYFDHPGRDRGRVRVRGGSRGTVPGQVPVEAARQGRWLT